MARIKTWTLCVIIFGLLKSLCFAQSGEIPLDSKILPAIVKIETISELSKKPVSGTGFIVGREVRIGSSIGRAYFLVTNKHMVSDWTLADGNISNFNKFINVYFYNSGHIAQKQPTRINLLDQQGHVRANVIYSHPDNSVDIAIIFLNAALRNIGSLGLTAFDVSYLRPFKAITSMDFNIGSEVFVLGYPFGITSLKTHYPIAKFGFIAATPGEEFAINVKDVSRARKVVDVRLTGKLLIIDGLIMPGNSGGPVVLPSVIRTRINQKTGKWEYWTKPNKNLVIGILSGSFGHSGLSYSYSSDYIVEAIDKFLSREGFHSASAWP